MRKKRIKSVIISAALAISLTCSVAGLLHAVADSMTTEFSFDGTLQDNYKVSDVLEIPSATLGDVEAEFRIILPDGTYSNKERFELSMPGAYTIEYTAVVDGKIYKMQKTFVVSGDLFTLNGTGSSEYITIEETGVSGMYFNMYNGDSIVYNDIVDLTLLNGPQDTLYKMFPMVSTVGEADITQYEVTLTDAYDENNAVTVRFKKSSIASANDYKISYVEASFNGSKFCGLEQSATGQYTVENLNGLYKGGQPLYSETYRAHVNTPKYGAPILASFTGGTQQSPLNSGNQWVGIAYDMNTNIVYATCSSKYRVVVADFENADIFGEKFQGFTDGKVKISIKPTIFEKGSCGIFISEFAGKKFTEEDTKSFVSSYAPNINVDYKGYSKDNLPKVRKGASYQIFDATAYDIVDGNLPVKVSVYYGYSTKNKVQVELIDGKFTANRLGTYTVVYQAMNKTGKITTEILEIESENNVEELSAHIIGEIDYNVSVSAGNTVKVLEDYQVVNAYGKENFSAKAVLKSDSSVCFELNQENDYSFMPIVSGEYEIVYTVSDYSQVTTFTRTLTVIGSNTIYYTVNGAIPEYLIKNGLYDLSVVDAYTLDKGTPIKQSVLLYVDLGNGSEFIPIDGIMEIKDEYLTSKNTVNLVYMPDIENAEERNAFVREIPVIDAGLYTENMDKSKYFVVNKGEVSFKPDEYYTNCEIRSLEDGTARFTFANYLNVNPFKIKLGAYVKGDEFVAFDRVNVYLYDAINTSNYIVVSLFKDTEGWFVTVNEKKSLKLSNTWGGADDEFYVNFSSAKNKCVINNFFTFTDINFYGTDDTAVYTDGAKMVIEVISKNGCDGIQIRSVNDAEFDKYADMSPASVDVSADTNAGEWKIGETVTLLPFAAYDVFAPYMEVKVSVSLRKDGDAKKADVKSVDGIKLYRVSALRGYEFVLSEYGTYTVQISAEDGINSDNDASYSYSITIADYTKPIVNITDKKTSYAVGDTFTVPKFTVDISQYNWCVIVENPDDQKAFVNGENGYVFNKAGKYKISLLVYDVDMNITEVVYTVTVK